MKSASILHNESERLAALDEYDILDTLPEQAYDQLTELASSVCGMPIALVSLIDEKRQWFKSHHGVDTQETPRDIAFCAHTIEQEDVFEIEDTRKDDRFYDNPLVTGTANITFYAGAPLITPNGLKLGTLCVIDNKPSHLTNIQKRQLKIIAQQVVAQLELRKAGRIQHELLAQAEHSAKTLEAKNKELEQFVFAVSHDLKSPLLTINGFVTTLAKELSVHTTEKQKHRFNRILDNVARMGSLFTHLLQLSRVMNGEITKVLFDSTMFIEQSRKRLLKEHKDLDLEFNLQAPLHLLYVNQTLLCQCIDNLLSNAIRYRSPERQLQLNIYTEESVSSVSLFISDNGSGIAKIDHERVFNVFEQIVEGECEDEGTGVGLSIVKAAMEKHNGNVKLKSELGLGSCFELSFPKE